MDMPRRTLQKIVLVAAIGCFMASLFLPAFSASNAEFNGRQLSAAQGWEALAFGWIDLIFIQTPALAWLANPFFALALFEFWRGQYRSSMWLAMACVMIGASFFLFSAFQPMLVVFTGDGQTLYHPEPEPGFISWMASFVIILAGGAVLGASKKDSQ
jgi:hypothetical protein